MLAVMETIPIDRHVSSLYDASHRRDRKYYEPEWAGTSDTNDLGSDSNGEIFYFSLVIPLKIGLASKLAHVLTSSKIFTPSKVGPVRKRCH